LPTIISNKDVIKFRYIYENLLATTDIEICIKTFKSASFQLLYCLIYFWIIYTFKVTWTYSNCPILVLILHIYKTLNKLQHNCIFQHLLRKVVIRILTRPIWQVLYLWWFYICTLLNNFRLVLKQCPWGCFTVAIGTGWRGSLVQVIVVAENIVVEAPSLLSGVDKAF